MPEFLIGNDFTPDNRAFVRTTVAPRLPEPVMHAGGIEFGRPGKPRYDPLKALDKPRYDPLKALDAWSIALNSRDTRISKQ